MTEWIVTHVRTALPIASGDVARAAVSVAARSARGMAVLRDHLKQHPDALTSGHPDVAPVVCRFIRALADAGTGAVLPECSRCHRLARRLPKPVDGGRICPSCVDIENAEPCSRCGRLRPVVTRDSDGPVCQTCRARDHATHRACGTCGQVERIVARSADGAGMCRRCYQARRVPERCCRCGEDRVPATRTSDGPVCERCYRTPDQRCDGCGRIRPLKTRRTDVLPALCSGCYRGRSATCTTCGRVRPTKRCSARQGEATCASCWPRSRRVCARCQRVKAILTRWPIGDVCAACYAWVRKHPATCTGCGAIRPLIGTDSADTPICGPCAGQSDRDYTCPRCGESGFAQTIGRCLRCEVGDRIHELLADADGVLRLDLQPFVTALATVDSPNAVLQWLRPGQPAAHLLEWIHAIDVPVTHDLLDCLPPGLAVHRLRQTLVHTGVLPERDEYLERLVPWLDNLLADQPATRAHLLRTYATWTVLRRARYRARSKQFTPGANNWARSRLRAALRLLCWIDEQGLELGSIRQDHIDQWLLTGRPESTYPAREFLHWARQRRLAGAVAIPKKRSRTTLAPITDDERWQQLRRCLHDNTLPTPVRAAGALVLLYGLPVSRVALLRCDDIHIDTDQCAWVHYGRHRLRLPPAVAAVVLAQRDQATTVSPVGRSHPGGVAWLFPGGFPGRPARDALYRGLRLHLHVHLRRARSAALAGLAAELPAAVLAQLLDININTALTWTRHTQADWTAYLAARRNTTDTKPCLTNKVGLIRGPAE
ncbi:hypothetical protein [Kibdelosporangium philippinense]|uniref:hypothetical protein n=1 Tax=Kibdelosporangium philippinense TaxID=211113 RepID=UPI0036150E74